MHVQNVHEIGQLVERSSYSVPCHQVLVPKHNAACVVVYHCLQISEMLNQEVGSTVGQWSLH